MQDKDKICQLARSVIESEAEAILALKDQINADFMRACEHLLGCRGRIIVMGIGKSGHIARKIAATFASTGSPAFFIHPAEAKHGDFGMITPADVVLLLSNSGETVEILDILPCIKRLGVLLITFTGNSQSTLARAATVNIHTGVKKEACPLGLAPTTSTTAALVMGDALAVSLLEKRGFTAEDFARSHPGGALGRRLLLRVDELMHTGEAMPQVDRNVPFKTALMEMTRKKLGMTLVMAEDDMLAGIFTDGDVRRAFDRGADIHLTTIHELMTHAPRSVPPGTLAAEALQIMNTNKITSLVVTRGDKIPLGVVHMHDILRAGII